MFLLDPCIFTTIDETKEESQSTLQIFLKDVTEGKNVETHTHSCFYGTPPDDCFLRVRDNNKIQLLLILLL